MERDEARYVPVETVGVWAWQVDFGNLQKLGECMKMLQDYGVELVLYLMGANMPALAVRSASGAAQTVCSLDWIVFENGEVKTVSQQAFAKNYRKFTNTTK